MIEAIDDKIIVEYLKATETKSGLIIPEGAQEPQGYGKVLSIGNKVEGIKKDTILVFHVRAGMDMLIGSKVYKCIKQDEIYGVLKDKELEGRLKPLEFTAKPKIVTPPEKKIIV